MKKFTIELDETVVEYLEFVSAGLNKPIETIISDGIYNQVLSIEEKIKDTFSTED